MNWQPIETAPRDGTEFLAYWPSANYEFANKIHGLPGVHVTWQSGDWLVARNKHHNDVFWHLPGDDPHQPTHWTHLPPPPGEAVPPAVKVDQIEAITMHFLGHPTGDPAPHLDWPISRQWTSKEVKKRMQSAFEAVGLTPSPDHHHATEQPDAVQEATHWALHSATGTTIGLWDEERLARGVLRDCPEGTTITALRALEGGE